MLQAKLVLVDQTRKIPASYLTSVAAAIQTQVNRDFSKYWPVTATVTTMEASEKVPHASWPIYIVEKLAAGEGGYHNTTGSNQPYSVVAYGPGWTVAASHEALECLVDPYGNRLQTALSMQWAGQKFASGKSEESFLVEVCDPCELNGYTIDGIALSDFITPAFYQTGTTGLQYSFTGNIKGPMEILLGGYISWITQDTNEIMQWTWLDPSKPPQLVNLGSANGTKSLREFVDEKTGTIASIAMSTEHPAVQMALGMGRAAA